MSLLEYRSSLLNVTHKSSISIGVKSTKTFGSWFSSTYVLHFSEGWVETIHNERKFSDCQNGKLWIFRFNILDRQWVILSRGCVIGVRSKWSYERAWDAEEKWIVRGKRIYKILGIKCQNQVKIICCVHNKVK